MSRAVVKAQGRRRRRRTEEGVGVVGGVVEAGDRAARGRDSRLRGGLDQHQEAREHRHDHDEYRW